MVTLSRIPMCSGGGRREHAAFDEGSIRRGRRLEVEGDRPRAFAASAHHGRPEMAAAAGHQDITVVDAHESRIRSGRMDGQLTSDPHQPGEPAWQSRGQWMIVALVWQVTSKE